MVATKRVPLAEVDNCNERRQGINEGGSTFREPLGGFIFVCNNDTMGEDFERHLFGLPQRYHDSVKAIQPGLPLFLYNYSTRCLHGVFEASSDGGLNIEPDAWGENKDSRKSGRQSISRFPAQVRVRWREERQPLEEEKFRPVLYHYDGPKFRLQLSKSEAELLLSLFGASPVKKIEELQEDTGGEWEKVKAKNKTGRGFRSTLTSKGPLSPSSMGRRRGPAQNGSSSNGGGSLPAGNYSVHEAASRGRERDSQTENAHKWRIDSDSWSGSSSAGTTSSSGWHENDRAKKGPRENGFVVEIVDANGAGGGPGSEGVNGIASSKGVIHSNGSIDSNHKVEIRLIDDDADELNGFGNDSGSGAANSSTRSGFVSYSAALKSGMLAAASNGAGENVVSSPSISQINGVGTRSSASSYSSAATASSLSPPSASGLKVGDGSVERVDGSNYKVEGKSSRSRFQGEVVPNSKVRPSSLSSGEIEKQDRKADSFANGEGEGKRVERAQPWGKPSTAGSSLPDIITGQKATAEANHTSTVNSSGDSALSKKPAKEAVRATSNEGQNVETKVELNGQRNSEAVENSDEKLETVDKKNAWGSGDHALVRLLQDPDPAVNSSPVTDGTIEEDGIPDVPGRQVKDQSPALQVQQEVEGRTLEEKPEFSRSLSSEGRQTLTPRALSNSPLGSPGGFSSHVSHGKPLSVEAPSFQQSSRPIFEQRRPQYDNLKHERHQEDRPHFRKQQQGHPQEQFQPSTSILNTQSQQLGPGLVPQQISSPTAGMPQHYPHHHTLISPTPQAALYGGNRSRSRAGNGPVENVHGMAYRPVTRNLLDGESALSPLVPGGWGLQSPVLLMQPVVFPVFPTPALQMLVNAESIHAEILEFAQTVTPSAETRSHAEAAVECVRSSVKKLWPEADVEVFGSFATGLCLHQSDVDVVVVDAPPPDDAMAGGALSGARLLTPLIRALALALKGNEWCEGLNTIETASMPVIKLRCAPDTGGARGRPSVAIDITIGGKRSDNFAGVSLAGLPKGGGARSKPVNARFEAARNAHNGAAAREFVIERLRQLPALAPLVLLLKSFLRSRSLNDVYSGGLGSFALTLMLVFYLERAPISCGIPQESSGSTKSPSPASVDANALSVDTNQATSVTAESSVDLSDDDSSDSSVLTSTSASTVASTEAASLHGSSCGGGDSLSVPLSPPSQPDEPLLRKAGGIVEELLASMHSVASPNLGTLLVGFLHVFGKEIDFSRVRLVLKGKNGNLGGLFWHEKNARTLPLWIDDPLRPDANIGAGSFNIWQVQAAMREMLSVITSPPVVKNGSGRESNLALLQQFLANGGGP